nr:hypothetical protein [Tanacetum cinerariifolium]
MRKSKRVKRHVKQSTKAPTGGVVIRQTPVKSLSKKKEKMTAEKRKGINLLSEVALTKEAQYEEARKRSLMDFHKTHLSGFGTFVKLTPSATKIKPSITNEGTRVKPGVPGVTEEESTKKRDSGDDNTQSDNENGSDCRHETDKNESGFESDQEENKEENEDDDEEEEDEFVKTPSNDSDDEDETKIIEKTEGGEDEGIYYATNQFDDYVNVRLNEPVDTDKGLIQKEGEPEFEVTDSYMPQDQEVNMGKDDEEPKGTGKTSQQGPTQSWLTTIASSADKPLKIFDELMGTPIDFSTYIMNGLKITNLTQETLLGPAFRLLKGTRSNYVELEYEFEEFMNGNRQMVPVEYFFNNDLKYLQGGISNMTYTTSITKTKAAQYDLPGIKDIVQNIWCHVKVAYDKHALWVTQIEVMRKHGYGYLREIEVRRADNDLYTFKEGDFSRLRINDIEDMLILIVQNRLNNLSDDNVSNFAITL